MREAENARFRFAVTDTTTGQALPGLYPAAWMSLLAEGEQTRPESCIEKVEELVGGSILAQSELDLNVYYVLALNQDSTISVVDPLFGFGGTKLLAMINLDSPGYDWVLSPDQQRLYVTLPETEQVVLADTTIWEVKTKASLSPAPERVALQPDGAYLWVTLATELAALDPETLATAARIPIGEGPHELAFRDDSRYVFVTSASEDRVTVVDTRTLTGVRRIETGARPVSIAYSALAGAVYVSHQGDGRIVVLDGTSLEVQARIPARPGLGQIRFAPGGRLGFAVNPRLDTVSILDSAINRIVQVADLQAGPDQVAFSDELVYFRHRDSEIILMILLDEVGEEGATVPVVDFPGGQNPFGAGRLPSPAASIIQAPGATAVLVANAVDQVIYFYKEGMAAPMGGFKNYDREPRAVLVVDRSLSERSRPGVYETTAKLRRPGRYEVAFFLDTPRIVHCFEVVVEPSAEGEAARLSAAPLRVEPLFESRDLTAGTATSLRYRLRSPADGSLVSGLQDVEVLTYSGARWQQRQWAQEVEPGIYEITFVPPTQGSYRIAIESLSGHLSFVQSTPLVLRAGPPASSQEPSG